MEFDNVITDENIEIHPASGDYAMPFTSTQKNVLGVRTEEFSCFGPDEALELINTLPEIAFTELLTVQDYAVLSMIARSTWGQGLSASNFCFLYFPDSKDTQFSCMKGLGERAFLTSFENLLRRGLVRRIDRYSVWDLDTDTTAPPESYHYDARAHCWTYAPALTYIDIRKFFIAWLGHEGIKEDAVVSKYFVELDVLEQLLFSNFQKSQALWKAEILKTVNSIAPDNIKQHGHLVSIRTGKK